MAAPNDDKFHKQELKTLAEIADQLPALARIRILIATPTADGSVRHEYMNSVVDLIRNSREDTTFELITRASSMLQATRNMMASLVALGPQFTHILFVDSDITFRPEAIWKMLDLGEAVVGGAYPFRDMPWNYPVDDARQNERLRDWMSAHMQYPVKPRVHPLPEAEFSEVEYIGAGLLLVSRGALRAMIDQKLVCEFKRDPSATSWYSGDKYYGFFDTVLKDGYALGEDYSFCDRWRQTGGKIHALVSEELGHIGPVHFRGIYKDSSLE